MLVDELLTPANCQLPQSSPIANELLAYVLAAYPDKARETQAIIFAVAHLRYSRRKKINIHEFADQSTGQVDDRGARSFAAMARGDFEPDCREAFTLFDKLHQDALIESFNSFDSYFTKAITPVTDAMVRLGAAPPLSKWRALMSFLFVDSLKHFVLLFMALFFWALGIAFIIDKAIPPLRAELAHFLEEEEKWFFPPDSAGS